MIVARTKSALEHFTEEHYHVNVFCLDNTVRDRNYSLSAFEVSRTLKKQYVKYSDDDFLFICHLCPRNSVFAFVCVAIVIAITIDIVILRRNSSIPYESDTSYFILVVMHFKNKQRSIWCVNFTYS